MSGPLISLAGVRREFPAGDQTIAVLKDIDLTIEAGEMVAIVGASGLRLSATISPSLISMMRWAWRATFISWVTMMMV